MRKELLIILIVLIIGEVNAQWDDGILLNVQEINLNEMRRVGMGGEEAVLLVMEQFIDRSYNFVYLSRNYLVPKESREFLDVGKDRMLIIVIGYVEFNNLLYAQVYYDEAFFILAVARNDRDFIRINEVPMVRLNYDKYNSDRRNNVLNVIKRSNMIPFGVER